MTAFQPGDIVWIMDKPPREYGSRDERVPSPGWNGDMSRCCGKLATIKGVTPSGNFYLREYLWDWKKDWLTLADPSLNPQDTESKILRKIHILERKFKERQGVPT